MSYPESEGGARELLAAYKYTPDPQDQNTFTHSLSGHRVRIVGTDYGGVRLTHTGVRPVSARIAGFTGVGTLANMLSQLHPKGESRMGAADKLIKEVLTGSSLPSLLNTVTQPDTGGMEDPVRDANAAPGGDRSDPLGSLEGAAALFNDLVARYAQEYPYVDPMWVLKITDELRAGANPAEMAQLARVNRDDYIAQGFNVADGGVATWDAIYNALVATATTQPAGRP